MEKLTRKFMPLNIQLFAENGTSGDGTPASENTTSNPAPQPKTYSEDEYNKLKSALDKANAEAKQNKEALRAKQTDEEKAKELQENQAKEHEAIKKELRELKLSNSLISGGYTQEEATKIIELRLSDDDIAFAKYLNELRKGLIDQTTQETKKQFSKENHVPGGTSGDGTTSRAIEKAKSFHKADNTDLAWGIFKQKQ